MLTPAPLCLLFRELFASAYGLGGLATDHVAYYRTKKVPDDRTNQAPVDELGFKALMGKSQELELELAQVRRGPGRAACRDEKQQDQKKQ